VSAHERLRNTTPGEPREGLWLTTHQHRPSFFLRKEQRMSLTESLTPPRQKGRGRNVRLVTLSFDLYSLELLRELAPSKKALGSTLCSLIQAEVARRREWQARRLEAAP
jgi:hypothetical protein